MKKNFIYGFLLAIGMFTMYSYSDTRGYNVGRSSHGRYIIPLKQRNVIVTQSYDYMKKLLKKGYICEDVDIVGMYKGAYTDSYNRTYYTMIKY